MAKIFVSEIRENDTLESAFLVREKTLGVTREGNSYVSLRLMDRTGEIRGRIWENAEESAKRFEKDDFIKVKGRARSYQGALQLNIVFLNRISENEVDLGDFLPQARRDREEMMAELKEVMAAIKDPHMTQLLALFLEDKDFVDKFKKAPAAKGLHHSYLGGLIEHTLSVVKLLGEIVKHYSGINRDLLVTAGFLHDVGKVYELSYSQSFDYTDGGRLLGHIVMGLEMVDERISGIPGFPVETAMLLKHLLISHHGHYEFGSPKRPKTIEALILYYVDDLDAKMESMQSFIEQDLDQDKRWTPFHRFFDRFIFKKSGGRPPGGDEFSGPKLKKTQDL